MEAHRNVFARCTGKILADDKTVESLNFKEGKDFMVVMVSKVSDSRVYGNVGRWKLMVFRYFRSLRPLQQLQPRQVQLLPLLHHLRQPLLLQTSQLRPQHQRQQPKPPLLLLHQQHQPTLPRSRLLLPPLRLLVLSQAIHHS